MSDILKDTGTNSKSTRGGKRKGAGRKPQGLIAITPRILPATKEAMDEQMKAKGLSSLGKLLDKQYGSD